MHLISFKEKESAADQYESSFFTQHLNYVKPQAHSNKSNKNVLLMEQDINIEYY